MSNRSERKMRRWRTGNGYDLERARAELNLPPHSIGYPRFRCTVSDPNDLRVFDPETKTKKPLLIAKFTRAASAQDAAEQMKRAYGVPFAHAERDE